MRLALLHADGDEALARQIQRDLNAGDTIVGPLSSSVNFGAQLIVLVVWTARAAGHDEDVLRLIARHDGVLVLLIDDTPAPLGVEASALIGPAATPRSIATAMRLLEIDRAKKPLPAERVNKRGGVKIAAAVLGFGAVAALGAAGAATVILDRDAPQRTAEALLRAIVN